MLCQICMSKMCQITLHTYAFISVEQVIYIITPDIVNTKVFANMPMQFLLFLLYQ